MMPPGRSLALEDDDGALALSQLVGGCETGDTGADDSDVDNFVSHQSAVGSLSHQSSVISRLSSADCDRDCRLSTDDCTSAASVG